MEQIKILSNSLVAGILLSLLFVTPGITQTMAVEEIRESLDQHAGQVLQEKVFVHTDRAFYFAGETMWFKGYVVEGSSHKPLDLSKVVYVEVVDYKQKPVLQTKINMKGGDGNGSFYLPLSLISGNYKFRAYTNWMKNLGPDFYFEKEIKVVNTFTNPNLKAPENQTADTVAFFPEGGSLVEGIRSKIAFKATDKEGNGLYFRGFVLNQEDDTVAAFQPLKFGIGHFYLTPSADMRYRALIQTGRESIDTYELPKVLEQGYVMQVEESISGQLTIKSKTNSKLPGYLYLLVHTRQNTKVAEAKRLVDGEVTFILDRSKLGEGISHITLFNQSQQPVCERLYFKRPVKNLQVEATASKKVFAPRELVSIDLAARDASGTPAVANMSVAVFQLDSLGSLDENNSILNYLWLTSDLKGKVESPQYYFQNSGPETAMAMDNLMLTHGWRKFRWDEVLENEKQSVSFLPEYEGHLIEAEVVNKETGTPAAGVNSLLSIIGKPTRLYHSRSNTKGKVQFISNDLFGTKEILIQSKGQEDSLFHFYLLSPYSKEFSDLSLAAFDLDGRFQDQLRSRSTDMQVQNIFWEETQGKFKRPLVDSAAFYGNPANKYALNDYVRFPTMEEVMREYVLEVAVRKRNGDFLLRVYNQPYQAFFNDNPLVLLDGVPVWEMNKIMSINPFKIKALEIVTDRYFLGEDMLFGGIISYTTYEGGPDGFEVNPHQLKMAYEGMQLKREFYSPMYDKEAETDHRKPDFRSLLFWSPDIVTNREGNEQLDFYTSDLEGEYVVVIQGITQEGYAGFKTFPIKVKKQLK